MDEIIDPTLGITPEKSNKPQEVKPPKVSRITPYRQTTGYPVGTDLFGKSNLDRVNEEYGGVNVFTQDFERLRAAEQPWGQQFVGFVNQAIGEIVGGTIEGVGYLGEIPNVLQGVYDSEQEFGNALSRYGASIKEGTRDATPIYTTGSGWDPGDWGWWFSNGVSIASTLSLMIPARGVSAGLGLLGRGASRLGRAGKALNGVLQIGGESGQIVRQGITQAVTSRHMENMMEAAGTYEDEYLKLTQKGLGEEDARKYASEAASTNYRLGWAMLGQDILQYTLMAKFKNPYNPTNPNRLEEAIYRSVGKAGKVGRYLNKNRGIGSLAMGFISEGAEEAYQYVIAEEAKYLADVSAGIADESNFSERFGDYTKDGELWTSAFFGAFGGAVFQATGAYAENKINKEWLEKRENWLKLRGSTLGKMQGDIAKAREAGDVTSEINAVKNSNLTITVDAIKHDQFDFHLSQYEEYASMTPEDIQQYNEANPGAEITPEFVREVVPVLIKDAKRIKEVHDNLAKEEYVVSTLGAMTARQFLGEVYEEKQKIAATNKSTALDNTLKAFPVSNTELLNLSLQAQALTASIENVKILGQDTSDTNTKTWTNEKLSELEKKLSETTKAIEALEDKSDINNVNAILADNTVAVPNATSAIFEMYKEKELQEASRMKTKQFQENTLYESTVSLINATQTESQIDNLKANLNTLKLSQEQIETLKSIAEQKKVLLQNTKTQEEVAHEEKSRIDSVTTENDFENANDFNFSGMDIGEEVVPEAAPVVVTPTVTPTVTPVVEQTPVVTSEIEAKKADIEKRRQEELKNKYGKNLELISSKNNTVIQRNGLWGLEGKDYKPQQVPTEQIFAEYDNINAKYDAELAALEQTPQPAKEETSIPSEEAVAQKVEQKKSIDKVFNLVSNYSYANTQGWKTWLDSGANPETAKVELLEATSFYKEGERLKTLFDKLKNNETLSKEDKVFLIDNYPLEVRVLGTDGSPLIMDGNEVRNYLYTIKSETDYYVKDHPKELSVHRQIRGQLLLQLAKGNVSIKLKGQPGGLSTVLDKPSITEEHNIESLDEFRLTGTPGDFLMINQDGNYSDMSGNLDLDTAKYPKPSKEDGNPLAGNIFVKVKSPTGVIIPVKLNKKKIDNTEAEFIYRLFADLLALDKHGFKKPIPEDLRNQLDVLVPEEGIFSQNPTYGEVINFFLNYKGNEVDLANPLPHDFALINRELKFNFTRVTDGDGNPRISASTLTLGMVQNQGVASNTIRTQEFINFLQGLRRQIDTKRLVNDITYREHITGNKILNTDFAQGKVFKPNSGQLQVEIVKGNSNVTTSKPAVVKTTFVQNVSVESKKAEIEQLKEEKQKKLETLKRKEKVELNKLQEEKQSLETLLTDLKDTYNQQQSEKRIKKEEELKRKREELKKIIQERSRTLEEQSKKEEEKKEKEIQKEIQKVIDSELTKEEKEELHVEAVKEKITVVEYVSQSLVKIQAGVNDFSESVLKILKKIYNKVILTFVIAAVSFSTLSNVAIDSSMINNPQTVELTINGVFNIDKLGELHRQKYKDRDYIVLDKQSRIIKIFKVDGTIIYQNEAIIGKHKGDFRDKEALSKIGYSQNEYEVANLKITPSGVFTGVKKSGIDYGTEHKWVLKETLVERKANSSMIGFHANLSSREHLINNNNISDNAASMGCFGINKQDFKKVEKNLSDIISVYILPETENRKVFDEYLKQLLLEKNSVQEFKEWINKTSEQEVLTKLNDIERSLSADINSTLMFSLTSLLGFLRRKKQNKEEILESDIQSLFDKLEEINSFIEDREKYYANKKSKLEQEIKNLENQTFNIQIVAAKVKTPIGQVQQVLQDKIMNEAIKNKEVVTNPETVVDDTKVVVATQSENMQMIQESLKKIRDQRKNKNCQ